MLRPRIIATLLLHKGGLYKTRKFKDHQYVGDPLNAVKIFNEKEIDELLVLDIDASSQGLEPNYKLIQDLAKECRMPLGYGGGIKTAEQAKRIISLGVEKVSFSSLLFENPEVIPQITEAIGRQSVVATFDFKLVKSLFRSEYKITWLNGQQIAPQDWVSVVSHWQSKVGEIVINSVDRDGEMIGYDLELIREVANVVQIPLTVLGGCGSLEHIKSLVHMVSPVGAAAGSLFVFKGKYRAVLINYPNWKERFDLYL